MSTIFGFFDVESNLKDFVLEVLVLVEWFLKQFEKKKINVLVSQFSLLFSQLLIVWLSVHYLHVSLIPKTKSPFPNPETEKEHSN